MRTTTITITADGGGGSRLHLGTGLLAPRVIRRAATSAHVALVATTATLLGGDHARVELDVGPGCQLTVTDVAATVAYNASGVMSLWDSVIRVGDAAALCWVAEPLVVADGARVRRTLAADVGPRARLVLREALALGRHGERGGAVDASTRVRWNGRPALAEDLDLDTGTDMDTDTGRASRRSAPGMLGGHRFVDTVTAVGFRPEAGSATHAGPGIPIYQLAVPGAQARELLQEAHTSRLPALARRWAEEAARGPG